MLRFHYGVIAQLGEQQTEVIIDSHLKFEI